MKNLKKVIKSISSKKLMLTLVEAELYKVTESNELLLNNLVKSLIVDTYFSFDSKNFKSVSINHTWSRKEEKDGFSIKLNDLSSFRPTAIELKSNGSFRFSDSSFEYTTNDDNFETSTAKVLNLAKRMEVVGKNCKAIKDIFYYDVLLNEEYVTKDTLRRSLNSSRYDLEKEIIDLKNEKRAIVSEFRFNKLFTVGNTISVGEYRKSYRYEDNKQIDTIIYRSNDYFKIAKITDKSVMTECGKRLKISELKYNINSFRKYTKELNLFSFDIK